MGAIGPAGGTPVQRTGAVTQVTFERSSTTVTMKQPGVISDKTRKYIFGGTNAADWAEAAYNLSWQAVWVPDTDPTKVADKLKITFTAETDIILTNSTNLKFESLLLTTLGTKTYWIVKYKEGATTTRDIRFIVDATHPDALNDARVVANVISQSWLANGKAHIKTDTTKTLFEFWFDLPMGSNL